MPHCLEVVEPAPKRPVVTGLPEDVADVQRPGQIGGVHLLNDTLDLVLLPQVVGGVAEHREGETTDRW